jgi:hypothetical protein
MKFKGEEGMHTWLRKLEVWCESHPQGKYTGYQAEFYWLHQAVNHTAPGFAPHSTVQGMLADLRSLPRARSSVRGSGPHSSSDRHICLLFPGADVPRIPAEDLVRVEGLTHDKNREPIRRDAGTIIHGSTVVVRATDDSTFRGFPMPFLVGQAIDELIQGDGKFLVAWFAPTIAAAETFKKGTKALTLDIFGEWTTTDTMTIADIRNSKFPDPYISHRQVLEANFHWKDDGTLPYWIFDSLRLKHNIDVTGNNLCRTHGGNLYQCYATQDGRVPKARRRV